MEGFLAETGEFFVIIYSTDYIDCTDVCIQYIQ
jgi:hypothetical protein